MGIGIQPVITDHDLAFVGNVRNDPGDELQVVHPLELGAVVAVPVADPALAFQKGQSIQGQEGPDHVLADPLGLGLGPGPDPAVDVEAGVTPGENALRPLRAEQPLGDQQPEHFPGEDLGQPRVVDPGDLVEGPGLVHSALGHQEMEMRVKIDPVAKGLNGRDDPGHDIARGDHFEITDE